MSESPAIVMRGVTRCYDGRPVVHDLHLTIPRGCVYGLLGRNGAGKSTTIRMLTGMVTPDAGTIEVLGEDLRELRPGTRERIAYLAEGHPLYRTMTIAGLSRFQSAFYSRWNDEVHRQILDHFGLDPRQRVWRLSRGQRAQVALALAVAPDPELLILDDPTLGLDTVVRREFLESLIQIIQRQGRTILLSSHILQDVERVADRIGILVDGVLRVDCPTDHFTEVVRKLVLTFEGTPPPWPGTTGVVSDVANGTRREVVLANYSPEHYELARSLKPAVIDVIDLSLEDAFIEYTRGRRRGMPEFTRDPSGERPASPPASTVGQGGAGAAS